MIVILSDLILSRNVLPYQNAGKYSIESHQRFDVEL